MLFGRNRHRHRRFSGLASAEAHGRAFQVVTIDGRPIQGAVRDTVPVTPMMGRVRIAFDADNPGRWAFHCHNLYHMMTGMMMEFRYQGIVA
jgi:FtsP/CotA-like multicopper oxidase with cupredoxin domain